MMMEWCVTNNNRHPALSVCAGVAARGCGMKEAAAGPAVYEGRLWGA